MACKRRPGRHGCPYLRPECDELLPKPASGSAASGALQRTRRRVSRRRCSGSWPARSTACAACRRAARANNPFCTNPRSCQPQSLPATRAGTKHAWPETLLTVKDTAGSAAMRCRTNHDQHSTRWDSEGGEHRFTGQRGRIRGIEPRGTACGGGPLHRHGGSAPEGPGQAHRGAAACFWHATATVPRCCRAL